MSTSVRYELDQMINKQRALHGVGKEVNSVIRDLQILRGTGDFMRANSPKYIPELENKLLKLEESLDNLDTFIDDLYIVLSDGRVLLEEKQLELSTQYDAGLLR